MNNLFKLLLISALLLSLPRAASADSPAGHPGYLHALSDLRFARFLITRQVPGPRDHFAIESIDRAIREIKQASIDDGKDMNDHPQLDVALDDRGRFHRALELLRQAHEDIANNEDNVFAQGLQHRAIEHIDRAHHTVREIIDASF